MSDFRFAFRQLTKSPGFTVIAVITLALGIGLNTSMFSLMNRLLLQPLPYPDRDHLIRLYRTTPQTQTADHTAPDYLDLTKETTAFADLAAYRGSSVALTQAERAPVNLNSLRVSANFFSVLGMQPELGRFFLPEEDQPNSHVVILSHATWQSQFGGDPSVIGRTVRLDDEPTTIVGVMPAAFSVVFLWGPGDGFQPLGLTNDEKLARNNANLSLIARTHFDGSLAQINTRLANLAEQQARNRPREHSQDGLRAVTLQSTIGNKTNTEITWLLLGLAGFVLLIACANLANLQLARAIARAQEFAIRTALGASRLRLLRPLLCESLLLALAGGVLGMLVAAWSNAWITSQLAALGTPEFILSIDWVVLGFALGLSALTGLVFGIVPAWVISRVRVDASLKSGTRGNTGDRTQHRFRHVLIVAQFALALILLAGAGVFIRGLDHMLTRDVGWDRSSLLQAVVNLPKAKYPSSVQSYAFYTQLQERLRALPEVEDATVSWGLPIFKLGVTRSFVVRGRDLPPIGREPLAFVTGVMPSFFSTLKIKLAAGRSFSATDTATSPPVAIINQSMARALFPNENPIGRRIGGLDASNRNWMEIVGVMPDLGLAVTLVKPETQFQVIRPLTQETWNYAVIAIRAKGADRLAEPIRQVVAELDPTLPLQQINRVDQVIKRGTGGLSMVNTILVVFALLGLFLAALGLYGVIARLVLQRTSEIGVRIALGAQSRDVIWLILKSGLQLTLFGTIIGLLGAFALIRLVSAILPEMLPTQDPLLVTGVTFLLLLAALFACWLPARRASRLDPVQALRSE